jgi:hypothetical protein
VADGEVEVEDYTYGLRRTGLAFSARGPISCSIYDKAREVKRSGKLWFEDLWLGNGWDGAGAVWRVEFRFKREFLHELNVDGLYHGVEDATDLPSRLVDLWAYAAGHVGGGADGWPDGWLRLVVPVLDDGTRSRWPVHPVWQEVQAAFSTTTNWSDDFHEVIRKHKQGWNTDRAIESTMGFATSLAAHVGGELAGPDADSRCSCTGSMRRGVTTWKSKSVNLLWKSCASGWSLGCMWWSRKLGVYTLTFEGGGWYGKEKEGLCGATSVNDYS